MQHGPARAVRVRFQRATSRGRARPRSRSPRVTAGPHVLPLNMPEPEPIRIGVQSIKSKEAVSRLLRAVRLVAACVRQKAGIAEAHDLTGEPPRRDLPCLRNNFSRDNWVGNSCARLIFCSSCKWPSPTPCSLDANISSLVVDTPYQPLRHYGADVCRAFRATRSLELAHEETPHVPDPGLI